MTTPPDDNIREAKPGEGDQPEERLDFAIVPKENPDGTPLDPDETRRRLDAQRWQLEQLAPQYGLEVREVGQYPTTSQIPTARANRVSREAQPGMDTTAEGVKEKRNEVSVARFHREVSPDKVTTEFSLLHIASMESIGEIVSSFAGIVSKAIPFGKAAVAIKVGWFKMTALVQHDGESKGEKQDDR
jgi:hypothetical protein